MARMTIQDYLQAYPFHLMDVSPVDLPSVSVPVFTPLLGFSSITSPEITAETQDILEGNWYFNRTVFKRANISPITIQRAVHYGDHDFWAWFMSAVTGNLQFTRGVTPRKTLLLVHYLSRSPFSDPAVTAAVANVGMVALGGLSGGPTVEQGFLGTAQGVSAFASRDVGFDVAARIPAVAYLLKDCIPTRVKPASDFDASSGQVSIAELDLSCELVERISLADVVPGGGAITQIKLP